MTPVYVVRHPQRHPGVIQIGFGGGMGDSPSLDRVADGSTPTPTPSQTRPGRASLMVAGPTDRRTRTPAAKPPRP